MTNLKPGNDSFYRSTAFFRQLQKLGVRHVIISPGSRSTPLTLAAAAINDLQKHVILDERSAAFTALGIGKSTGSPAVLVCTSGTAVANYFPAVIEARQSGVPVILASADRPAELVAKGANQAISQQHIFGDYPVFFEDVYQATKNDIEPLKKLTKKAFKKSVDKQGPAHLNFPFRKPLEPSPDFLEKVRAENEDFRPNKPTSTQTAETNTFSPEGALVDTIQKSDRPLLIVGQLSPSSSLKSIFALAEQLQIPVISEFGIPESDHGIQGFDGFLRSEENIRTLRPDLILRFGLQPASKSVLQAVQRWNPNNHIYFSDTKRKINIADTTSQWVEWNGAQFDTEQITSKPGQWLKQWQKAEQAYFKQAGSVFNESACLTDGHIYRHIVPQIPDDYLIGISNSLPARDQSLFARFGPQSIVTNRGVSGIDGVTSTMIGASIGSRQPTVLFTGDLAFLHDSNALLNHKLVKQPLVIIVINNSGGSIFRMLPIADRDEYFEPYFETPQSADISSLAASHHIPCHRIDNREDLSNSNLSDWINQHPGCSIIEFRTDADASMQLRKKLWDIRV